MSFQKITIVGRVGGDAELKYTPDGTPVASFNVATSNKYTGKDGQKHDDTTWHRCTAWRKTAETAGEYVKKGMLIMIEGPVKARGYQAKGDGGIQGSLEVTVNEMKFLSRGTEDQGGGTGQAADSSGWGNDDDIPF